MSRYRDDSEVAAIERAAGPVVPSPAVRAVLERSLHWARACEGAFDPTVGALTRLWNFPDAAAARTPPPLILHLHSLIIAL